MNPINEKILFLSAIIIGSYLTFFGVINEFIMNTYYVFVIMALILFLLCSFSLYYASDVGIFQNISNHISSILVLIVVIEELFTNSINISVGLNISIITLIVLPLIPHILFRKLQNYKYLFDSISLVLLSRIVLAPFPVSFIKLPFFLPSVYMFIIIPTLLYVVMNKIKPLDIRLNISNTNIVLLIVYGLLVGTIIGIIEFVILSPNTLPNFMFSVQKSIYIITILGMLVGISEELLFRGLLLYSLEQNQSKLEATIISSCLFGMMHLGWLNPLETVFAFGSGIIFVLLMYKTESI